MGSKNCSIDGCIRPYAAKGYCNMHYNRQRRHGDPLKAHRMVPRGSSLRERLEVLRMTAEPDDCWIWVGTIHNSGYGVMQYQNRLRSAHVWAYEDAYGPVLIGMQVLHSCDNRRCVNPRHLRIGTHQENMDDKVERNRCSRLYGEDAPSRKITEVQAVEIIQRYATEKVSSKTLAADYGISASQVQNIVNGKRWIYLDRKQILRAIA